MRTGTTAGKAPRHGPGRALHERGIPLSCTARLSATVVASAAILAAAALPASAAGHPQPRPSVTLGAIQYDSPGADNRSARSLNSEWVTVTNTGRYTVNIAGWTLTDASHHTYRFHTLRLGAHQSVKVHTGSGRNTSHDVYQNSRGYIWNNDADTATLRDNRGHSVDTKSWGHRNHR
jgi:hypothetical protein